MTNGSTLAERLRGRISALAPGDKLPTSRQLMAEYGVGPGTVARAIAALAAEGVVVTRPGSGTFVAPGQGAESLRFDLGWQTVALADRAIDTANLGDILGPAPEGTIMLNGGYLHPSLQPRRMLSAVLARAARRPDAWDRAPISGLESLRSIFATAAGPTLGVVTADDVLITAGGQSALSMAMRAIAPPGGPVLVESPTYPGALAAARAAGLRPVPVPLDNDGLRPDLLAEAFELTGARLLYCQPAFHNPTGLIYSADRRRAVLDVARAAGAFVVEDDFARYLGHGTAVPRTLLADDQHGTVVQITSLTKATAPSMRLGALIARGPVMERFRAIRHVDDFFIGRPLQEAAVELLSSPGWERHVRGLASALRQRCHAVAVAIEEQLPDWTIHQIPSGGLHLWIELPHGQDDVTIGSAARRGGVAVSAGRMYFAAESPAAYLRLSFAAGGDTAELERAVTRLSRVCRQVV
ncbi:PLP-dependent aminotransferase family protein [Kribbella sancticallisti]|uniref:PLP-dependent aminotransferase family protein n=1 Tax=Kribbella sancticallisti TaxID=460087 RepID=A0ABN2DSK0_9ACTN